MGPVADIRASPASSRPVARTSALGQCLRPSLRAMQDAKDTDRRFRHDIGRDIRRAGDHQFTRPGDPSRTAAFGKIAQAARRTGYSFIDRNRSGRVICLDMREYAVAIGERPG